MTDLLSAAQPFDDTGPNPWQQNDSRIVFDDGRLRVRQDAVIQPDGQPGQYTYVDVSWPVVVIVPVTEDGYVHLVRQWRYPWGRNSWEVPAGHCEPHEPPLDAAKRELAEEVGLSADQWESLGQGFGSAAVSARYHLYLARGLTPAGHSPRDGSEADMQAARVRFSDAVRAAEDGTIVHAISVIGLLRANRRLAAIGGGDSAHVNGARLCPP